MKEVAPAKYAILKYDKSTSVMHTHLKQHPQASSSEGKTDNPTPVQTSMNTFTKRPAVTDKKRQQITGLLVNFIVKDVRTLAAVHGEGLREMLQPEGCWSDPRAAPS